MAPAPAPGDPPVPPVPPAAARQPSARSDYLTAGGYVQRGRGAFKSWHLPGMFFRTTVAIVVLPNKWGMAQRSSTSPDSFDQTFPAGNKRKVGGSEGHGLSIAGAMTDRSVERNGQIQLPGHLLFLLILDHGLLWRTGALGLGSLKKPLVVV